MSSLPSQRAAERTQWLSLRSGRGSLRLVLREEARGRPPTPPPALNHSGGLAGGGGGGNVSGANPHMGTGSLPPAYDACGINRPFKNMHD